MVSMVLRPGRNWPSKDFAVCQTRHAEAFGEPAVERGEKPSSEHPRRRHCRSRDSTAWSTWAGVTAVIFMCVFGYRIGPKTIRCGRAHARSAAAIVHALLRTSKGDSRCGRMIGRWSRTTASEL